MELTDKILINNEKEAQNFIDNWKCAKVYSSLSVKDFEKYPALLSYYEAEGLLKNVDGMGDIDAIFEKIKKSLGEC